jgi:hypothetical protein
MRTFRKNIFVFFVTGMGVLGLLSVQFGRIIDFFPGVSISVLLAEELAETEGSEEGNEAFSAVDLFLTKEAYAMRNLIVSHAVEVCLHCAVLPVQPAFEKVTPPPKA